MAIPSFFNTSSGLALLRQSVATGEFFFVDWISGDMDVAVDAPGPGTWRYVAVLVCGAGGPFTFAAYGDFDATGRSARATLTVQSLKR
ncbi:MAG: hypothetical protein ACOYOH_29005 [Paracraurococcus sp.]